MPIENPSDIRLNERREIEAIIGNPPGWTLRWGILVLLLGFALLLVFSHFIKYPDVVLAPVVLTTEHPPIRVTAKADAKINLLKVTNGKQVGKGELLVVLDNPAKMEDVLQLQEFLHQLEENSLSVLPNIAPPDRLELGSLQGSYARFIQSLQDLKYFLGQDINYQKISNLHSQIAEIQRLNHSLERQEAILREEVGLARQNMERDSTLLARNSLSRLEFEQSQTAYLQKRRELESLRSGATQNELRIQQIRGQILELEQNQSDNRSERNLAFQAELKQLQGEITLWKEHWLITAPIDGEVALTKAWSEQQYVKEGEEVLTIVPVKAAGPIIAKALLPDRGAGKVREGMGVHIRLDGFPYQEYGVLNGSVKYLAPVPGEQGYEAGIEVPGDLITSYGKNILFRQEMMGTARIVTKDKSLLSRLLNKIISALKN
ncbi:MAG: HlyD family efflux transporter periplasmic adaptor subunit [Lewinellaceae bacterium]|nr:HlyD family efflux transporter periplasmic adaptor subunit [Saprospiraceae bacterium]MCB9340757.1 HlyD family efflux transporter periplasmic adaptor subunit [Lewinellaceae bacterium]